MNGMEKMISAVAAVMMAVCIAPLGFSQTSSNCLVLNDIESFGRDS